MKDFEIECDNCGSHDVHKVLAAPPRPPQKEIVKMSDAVSRAIRSNTSTAVPAIMHYTTYKYRCANCGDESKEFTQPFGGLA